MRFSGRTILTLLNYRIDRVAAARVMATVLTAAMVVAYVAITIIYLDRGEAGFAQGFEYETELVISIVVLWLVLLPIHVVWAACASQFKVWEKALLIASILGFAPFGMPVFLVIMYRRRAVQQGQIRLTST